MILVFNLGKNKSGTGISLPSYYKPEIDIISTMHLLARMLGYRTYYGVLAY